VRSAIGCIPLMAGVMLSGVQENRSDQVTKLDTVSRLCGHLYSRHSKPSQTSIDASEKTLRKTKVQLYRRQVGSACCKESELVSTKFTNWLGGFDFKKQDKGTYWIVVELQGKKSPVAMNLEPEKKYLTCSDLNFVIDERGILSYGVTITLD
jgi:hypothetical protein